MIIEEHEVCQRHHSSCWSRRRVSGLKFLARWLMKREMLCFFRYISRRSIIIQRQIKCKDELERDRLAQVHTELLSHSGREKFCSCAKYCAKLYSQHQTKYRGADKSLARPGKKQSTAIEDFVSYILFIIIIGEILVLFIYIKQDLHKTKYSHHQTKYRGADKSLVRPGRKEYTVTEDFKFHISFLQS
jgi:hypothetical protein